MYNNMYWHTIYLCRYASKNSVFILSHGEIFLCSKIIIPIIKNSHWTLVVVDFKRKELKYNSLQGQNEMEYMDFKMNLKVVYSTVEPLKEEPPIKGHCIKYLSTMDKTKSPNFIFPINFNTIRTS